MVVDFVGNCGRHKLIHASDVLGGKYSDEIVEAAERKIKERAASGVDTDVLEAMKWAEEQAEQRRREERKHLIAQASYFCRDVSPFDLFDIRAGREPGYLRGKKCTDKQAAFLKANGIRNPELMTLHKANKVIDEIKRRQSAGLCTARQAKLLAAYGYDTNVTIAEASRRIEEINARISRRESATPNVTREDFMIAKAEEKIDGLVSEDGGTVTYKGPVVTPTTMTVDDVDVEHIAHSLALTCRYNGACQVFYSNAQHSVLVSKRVCELAKAAGYSGQLLDAMTLFGLLHDGHEAYNQDMIRPRKRMLQRRFRSATSS